MCSESRLTVSGFWVADLWEGRSADFVAYSDKILQFGMRREWTSDSVVVNYRRQADVERVG